MMAPAPQPGQAIAAGGGDLPGQGAGYPDEQAVGVAQAPSLEEQFEALYATFFPRIVGYLTRLLGDQEQAEDAAQETFLKAWRHLGTLRPNSRISSWIYRVARNTALDLLRHRALIAWQSLQGVDAEDGDQDYDWVEVALLLQRAFDLLPPQHKRTLATWKGERPLAQMASILQTTEVAAKGRLSRARRAWRQSYATLAPQDQW